MADNYHSDTQEKVESIIYQPGLKDSGDLEPATKTITATSKPGAADYSASLIIPAPSDSRLVVKRLALKGNIRIDSFGGSPAATKLYCTVECNGVEKISAVELTSAGADNLFATDITADFNLGTANELKVYLWVDQGEALISICRLWLAVGTCATGPGVFVEVAHNGFVEIGTRVMREGTGSTWISASTHKIDSNALLWSMVCEWNGVATFRASPLSLILSAGKVYLWAQNSVSTDITYPEGLSVVLRSLQ